MMITSAQNGHSHDLTSPRTRRKRNKSLVQTTKQHRQDKHTNTSSNETEDRTCSSPHDVTNTTWLVVSPATSPSTSDSTVWTSSAGSHSTSGSTQTTDVQDGSCSIAESSIPASSEQFSTNPQVATTRQRAAQEPKSLTKSHRRPSDLSSYDCRPQEITGVLDPFLSLPLELSADDRMLLQYCKSKLISL